MTEITNHIIIPNKLIKIDIEKLVVWALRKKNYMYQDVNIGDEIKLSFNFDFVDAKSTPVSYNDIIGSFDTEPDTQETLLTDNKIMFRSPNNTMLFKHWVEENKIKKFTLQSFVSANVGISREQAIKIVSHQIHKKTILQIDNDTFKIIKEL